MGEVRDPAYDLQTGDRLANIDWVHHYSSPDIEDDFFSNGPVIVERIDEETVKLYVPHEEAERMTGIDKFFSGVGVTVKIADIILFDKEL